MELKFSKLLLQHWLRIWIWDRNDKRDIDQEPRAAEMKSYLYYSDVGMTAGILICHCNTMGNWADTHRFEIWLALSR